MCSHHSLTEFLGGKDATIFIFAPYVASRIHLGNSEALTPMKCLVFPRFSWGGSLEPNQAHKLPACEDRFLFGGVFVCFCFLELFCTPHQYKYSSISVHLSRLHVPRDEQPDFLSKLERLRKPVTSGCTDTLFHRKDTALLDK